jgi:hypothetical protein
LDQLNINRISGIRPYWIYGRISGMTIWYRSDTGYQKRSDYPASTLKFHNRRNFRSSPLLLSNKFDTALLIQAKIGPNHVLTLILNFLISISVAVSDSVRQHPPQCCGSRMFYTYRTSRIRILTFFHTEFFIKGGGIKVLKKYFFSCFLWFKEQVLIVNRYR